MTEDDKFQEAMQIIGDKIGAHKDHPAMAELVTPIFSHVSHITAKHPDFHPAAIMFGLGLVANGMSAALTIGQPESMTKEHSHNTALAILTYAMQQEVHASPVDKDDETYLERKPRTAH